MLQPGFLRKAGTRMPNRSSNGFLRIGHRGASAYAPENTLAAMRKAAELGADMVELDVQASADGVPVILHDAELSRTTSGHGSVYDHRLEDLKRLDAGAGESIPTLEEAIACCRDFGLGLYLEIKVPVVIAPIVAAIRRDDLHGHVIVSSFRPDWLADVKGLDGDVATAVLFTSRAVDPAALARAAGAGYVHPCWEWLAPEPHRLLTPEWMAHVRGAGLKIISWHEERPSEITALRRLGIDGICSNAPDLLLEDDGI
jgi:glycerophosphoryl diester phosphodiesterase